MRRHSLPLAVYALVEQTPATVLLEGASAPGNKQGTSKDQEPWTQLFMAPFRVCAAYEPGEIPGLFSAIESAIAAGYLAAGYFTYECGASFEPKAAMRPNPGAPLAWFGIYERSYTFNHDTGEFPGGAPPGLNAYAASRSDSTRSMMDDEPNEICATHLPLEPSLDSKFSLTEADYAERIARIHEWIRAGDIYQLNFTAPWQIDTNEPPAALYANLRARQPVEYGAFLHWAPGRHILSFSPELFFRVDHHNGSRRITTRPMKGTAPRGRTTAEDRANAEWLRNDPKNRSENVMIVDLVRNDLGRIARFGSVRVEDLFATERHPTLWQMTSTVTSELRPESHFEDIFRALFPCGSITGAPKVRAMQLIAEIETQPRGVYTGAIGFFSQRQTVFNVAIRTLELAGNRATMGTGSGIVIDSNADDEYAEVLLKADFLTGSPRQGINLARHATEFALIETMLWDGGFPWSNLHLDRLTDSAAYFAIPCDRSEVEAALNLHAERLQVDQRRRVRLLLGPDGSLQITDAVMPPTSADQGVGRVYISKERTDPANPMLFHKTTDRALYAEIFHQASAAGYDDALFFNLNDELTEGSISNIFIEKNGHWYTPPIECGLLAGVYRRHLLQTRPEIVECVLRKEDLQSADSIYLVNALRGLRSVIVDWIR